MRILNKTTSLFIPLPAGILANIHALFDVFVCAFTFSTISKVDWEAPVGGGEDNGEKGANIQQRHSQQSFITDINFLFRAFYLFIHLFIYDFFWHKTYRSCVDGRFLF